MLTYVLRKLMYMPFIMLGVVVVTFFLFTISTRPEALATLQLGEKASSRQKYEWLKNKGYVKWTERGEQKLKLLEDGTVPTRNTRLFNEAVLEVMALDKARFAEMKAELDAELAKIEDKESEAAQEISGKLAALGDRIYKNDELILAELKSARRTWVYEQLGRKDGDAGYGLSNAEHNVEDAEAALEYAKQKKRPLDEPLTNLQDAKDGLAAAEAKYPGLLAKFNDLQKKASAKFAKIEDIEPDLQYTSRFTMFLNYLGDLLRLDFGEARNGRPVLEILAAGMGPSLSLALPAFLMSELIALFFGLLAAMYRRTKLDATLVISSIVLMSINGIALIIAGQKVLASDWNYFPISGYAEGFGAVRFLLLPAILYVVLSYGEHVRFNRIVMLDEVGQDYVRTARAKGLNENSILFKHVLRNSLIPLITRWVVAIASLYTGSLILESFFGIPGLGYLTVDAISNSDGNVIRAIVVIGAVLFIFSNLLSDVLYALVDPRIRLS